MLKIFFPLLWTWNYLELVHSKKNLIPENICFEAIQNSRKSKKFSWLQQFYNHIFLSWEMQTK